MAKLRKITKDWNTGKTVKYRTVEVTDKAKGVLLEYTNKKNPRYAEIKETKEAKEVVKNVKSKATVKAAKSNKVKK